MPTYEYVCRNCGHGFEVVQSMRDEPLTICDVCGGELRKVFTAPAISFKGSGFYATDHGKRKVNEQSEKSGEKKDSKPSDAKSDSKSESKSSESKSSEGKSSEGKSSEGKSSESKPSSDTTSSSSKKETTSK